MLAFPENLLVLVHLNLDLVQLLTPRLQLVVKLKTAVVFGPYSISYIGCKICKKPLGTDHTLALVHLAGLVTGDLLATNCVLLGGVVGQHLAQLVLQLQQLRIEVLLNDPA